MLELGIYFLGLCAFGGLCGALTGVALARLGRRGPAQPQALALSPWALWLPVAAALGLPLVWDGGWWQTAIVLTVICLGLRLLTGPVHWFAGESWGKRWRWALRVWCFGMIGYAAVWLWNDFVFRHWIFISPPAWDLWLPSLEHTAFWQAALLLCLVQPVLEEMFFRGFLFRGFVGKKIGFSATRALALSSLLFALAHPPALWLPAFYLGALLAWLDWRSGDLRWCMLAHVIHNSLYFVWLLV